MIFQSLNSNFLSPANLVNLLLQSAAVGVIALGIVCVLLVGQIDLSVGSVSGLAAACFATLFVKQGWPLVFAVVGAVAVGAAIGWVYGQVFNRFGVPSFVITLGGLLGFLGLQLFVLGPSGTINLAVRLVARAVRSAGLRSCLALVRAGRRGVRRLLRVSVAVGS